MYSKIERGNSLEIQDLICSIPEPGYVFNIKTGKIEYREIYERSNIKENQYWERIPLPSWYKQIIKQEEQYEKARKDGEAKFYNKQLEEYTEQEWDRRLNGFWFMNNGEPVYLTGSHYVYLQWWQIDVGYPKFRMPDLEYFYFLQYCIEDPNCMGMIEVTKRRFGKTYRCGLFLYEYVTRTRNANAGIQSKTGSDAKKLFAKAVVNPFKKLPRFFRPEYDMSLGITPKTEIRFQQTNVRGKKAEEIIEREELGSMIDFQSADEVAYDGQKLIRYVADESGKTVEANVYDRHNVIRYCLLDDEGKIIGKALYTTTIEKLESENDGVQEAFRELWDDSNQTDKKENGRTASGLYRFFMTADRGRNIDIYGIPDVDKTITQIMADRAAVAHNPRTLSSIIRKEARTIQEAFRADGDHCLYDDVALNDQLEILTFREPDLIEKGDLKWKEGDKYWIEKELNSGEKIIIPNKLIWTPNPNGKYEKVRGWMPKENNNVYERNGYFFPNGSYDIRIGCDPFKYDKTKDKRRSDCSAYAYQMPDLMDELNEHNEMFTMRYVERAKTTDMQYDYVLKMAWFCGCQILFERNVDGWIKYFQVEKCSGFLMWLPGELMPGIYTDGQGNTVQTLCDYTEAYIQKHIKKVYFKSLIAEKSGWLGFRVEDTQKFDEPMSAGVALIAAKNKKVLKSTEGRSNVEDIMPYSKTG